MDPIEAAKWAIGATTTLGGIAFGLKKLLTSWGKESANASGVAAANEIIASLREEVEHIRKGSKLLREENEELLRRVSEQARQIASLQDSNHKLTLNNKTLQGMVDAEADVNSMHPTFTDSEISRLDVN